MDMISTSEEEPWEKAFWEGKTVDRVAMEERLSIRLARMADSWTVGMSYGEEVVVGLDRMCCGGGVWEAVMWRSEKSAQDKSILMDYEDIINI